MMQLEINTVLTLFMVGKLLAGVQVSGNLPLQFTEWDTCTHLNDRVSAINNIKVVLGVLYSIGKLIGK